MSIVEKLAQQAKETPEKLAVVFEGKEVTYAELWNKTVHCAHLLIKLGVQAGDRVVCQGKYDPHFWAIRFAAHLCGAAFVPADKDASPEQLAGLAERLDARLIISNCKEEKLPRFVLFDELADMLPEDTSMEGLSFPEPESVSEVMFTTGTTGASKGVLLTHRCMAARVFSNVREFDITPDDVSITMVPLNHIGPIMILDQRICSGATAVFLDGMMKLKLLFDCMDKYGVTTVFLPPAGIALLRRLSQNKLADYADQLVAFHTGSAAMTKPELEYLKKILPRSRLYTGYGSSECGVVSVRRYDGNDKDVICVGKPCEAGEVRIVDEAFRPVPAGNVGLITFKSEMNMLGYYNRPNLNAAVFHDGYFSSNDLGYLDEEGFLYILGRSDDMINIGGLKVYPSEVENAALRIPGVEECLCFGVPDPITGQAIKLLIKPGDAFSMSIPQVQEALSKSMDYYKVPKSIEFVTEIQKTANGKPERKFYQAGK